MKRKRTFLGFLCLFLAICIPSTISYGVDLLPEKPSHLEALVMYDQVNLLWQDNSTIEDGFIIERKMGVQDFSEIAKTKANCGFFLDMQLKSKTTYYYRVKSFNLEGSSEPTDSVQATTETAPQKNEPPEAPSNLVGKASTPTQIQLGWRDNSSNETGFQIARRTSGTPYQIKGDVFADTTQFIDNMVEPDTSYFYKIRAVNSYGESSYSEEIQIVTKSDKEEEGEQNKPKSPTELEAQLENNSIVLTWNDTSDDEESFRVYMAIDDPDLFAVFKDLPANITRHEETTLLIPGHTFFFRITAINKYGESQPSNEVQISIQEKEDQTTPEGPAELKALEVYATDIVLRWKDQSHNEEGFKVERRKSEENKFTVIQSLPANMTTYRDENLDPDTFYYYRVYAFNQKGSSFSTDTLEVRTKKIITPPPTDPTPPTDSLVIRLQIGSMSIVINGVSTTMDVAPMILFDRTVLPIRYVVEALGGQVTFQANTKIISIKVDKILIDMQLKNPLATVNGMSVPIDSSDSRIMPVSVPPGRTMVPLRFVAENLGCKVDWEANTKSIRITRE